MARNVTVGGANSSSILFNPVDCNTWNGGGWQTNPGKGASGAYKSCTPDGTATASAKLTFTGVAVYYQSIYFDNYSVIFSLDGVSSSNISLALPPGTRVSPNASKLMWFKEGLSNSDHTLEIFPGNNGRTLNIDAIVYTQADAGSISTQVPPSSSHAVSLGSTQPVPMAAAQIPAVTRNSQNIGLIVGTIFGVIAGIIFVVILFLMFRRQRELKADRRAIVQEPLPQTFSDRQFDSRLTSSRPGHAPIGGGDNEKAHTHTQQTEMSNWIQQSPPSSPEMATPVRPLPIIPKDTGRSSHMPMQDIREEDTRPLEWTSYNPSSTKTHRPHLSDDTNKSDWYAQSQTSLIRNANASTSGESPAAMALSGSGRQHLQNPFVTDQQPTRTSTVTTTSSRKLEPLRKGSQRSIGF
ncbi:hypothetical protein CPB83DRAFT_837876 [Crepidotus variabilis]|uniref:Uncharacterized protein n=1 Tax=Crepidotus variabilis TaxID=179855 RepID=A0A9P6JM57_9AGAR|nr:hypothetical protein CPB83DRAFT_837876 [Crepidotus variabilis]